jgi:hypothetical protein
VTSGVRSGWIGDRNEKLYRHTMEMEQLLAEIRTTREHMKEEKGTNQVKDRSGKVGGRFTLILHSMLYNVQKHCVHIYMEIFS